MTILFMFSSRLISLGRAPGRVYMSNVKPIAIYSMALMRDLFLESMLFLSALLNLLVYSGSLQI